MESDGDISADPDAILSITKEGQAIFQTLMTSNVRAPVNDVSKLVVALKLRFLHLLNTEYRIAQIEGKLKCVKRNWLDLKNYGRARWMGSLPNG